MTVLVAVEQGCTTIMVPGWAAVLVVLTAAAPRLAEKALRSRSGGSGK